VSRPELRGVELLVVDGNNLLHRIAGSVDEASQRRTFAQLRATLAERRTTVVLDGHPARGARPLDKPGATFEIRHAGGSADEAIIAMLATLPIDKLARTVVVTDDRTLAERSRHAGAETRRLAWLTDLLASPRHRALPAAPGTDDEEDERRPWQPGRGATRKRGNPRRRPRPPAHR